jgi:general secretion pathway protein A
MVAEKTNAPQFTFLKAISKELDIPPQRSAVAQMDALEEFLVEQYKDGKTVILMVDEAQLLRLESMECLRSLLNYETNTEKLCQVVLAGQLELRDRMHTRRYKAVRSRVVAPVVLELFTPEETDAMISFRHEYWQVSNRFTHEAVVRVQKITQGVPRDIVLICGYAYSHAVDHNVKSIGPEIIDSAARNLEMRKDRETASAVVA